MMSNTVIIVCSRMLCKRCTLDGRPHPWCLDCVMGGEESFADLLTGQLEVPWILDPPEWLIAEWTTPDAELPALTVEGGELGDSEAPGLQMLATVASERWVPLPEISLFDPMDLVNGVKLENETIENDSVDLRCYEQNSELSDVAIDRDQFERSRSPGEMRGWVGPN